MLTRGRWADTGECAPLMVLVVATAQIPLWTLLLSILEFLWMSGFNVEGQDARFERAVTSAVALAVMAVGLIAVWAAARSSIGEAIVATAVTIVLGLGIVVLGNLRADRVLFPDAAALGARVKEFDPPPGADLVLDDRSFGTAMRSWEVAGTFEEVCSAAEVAFRQWTGPDGDGRGAATCHHRAFVGDVGLSLDVFELPERGVCDIAVVVQKRV